MHTTTSDIKARFYNHSLEPGCVYTGVGGRPIVPALQGPRSEERSGEGGEVADTGSGEGHVSRRAR